MDSAAAVRGGDGPRPRFGCFAASGHLTGVARESLSRFEGRADGRAERGGDILARFGRSSPNSAARPSSRSATPAAWAAAFSSVPIVGRTICMRAPTLVASPRATEAAAATLPAALGALPVAVAAAAVASAPPGACDQHAHPGSSVHELYGSSDEPVAVDADRPQPWWVTARLLLCGGIAGAVSKTATAPLARLTILYQVSGMTGASVGPSHNVWASASAVVRNEGLRALWKGNWVTVIHRIPYSAMNFFAYEKFTALMDTNERAAAGEPPLATLARRAAAGGLAGIVACTAAYPLDLVRTRLAAQVVPVGGTAYYTGMGHCLVSIVRAEGVAGLYRGLGATLVVVGPNLAINFATYETLKEWVAQQADPDAAPPMWASLLCGSLAGLVSSTCTYPLDLVRRRLQLEGAAGAPTRYTGGYCGAVRHILATEGRLAFYRGIVPEYYKVMPGVGIAFMAYEACKRLFGVDHLD